MIPVVNPPTLICIQQEKWLTGQPINLEGEIGKEFKIEFSGALLRIVRRNWQEQTYDFRKFLSSADNQEWRLVHAQSNEACAYFLFSISGSSLGGDTRGSISMCAAGVESDLLWIRIPFGTSVTALAAECVGSCFSSLDAIETRLGSQRKWSGEYHSAVRHARMKKIVVFDESHPEFGLRVTENILVMDQPRHGKRNKI